MFVSNGTPAPACQADPHETYLSNDGTVVVPSMNYTTADLTSVGGSANACVQNYMLFEFNATTGETIFSWNPMD